MMTMRQETRNRLRFEAAVAALTRLVMPQPSSNPIVPPMAPIKVASSTYSRMMWRVWAPTGFFSPQLAPRQISNDFHESS